jgi:alpha-D-xyloside xylohydrolase
VGFLNYFRSVIEMRYRLMPYIYAQAKASTDQGLPMLRALFIEFPDDPGSWLVDDQYMFGSDMLVAPLMESGRGRKVYLPPGRWIDYQTGKSYAGGWHFIEKGPVEIIILVKDGVMIPHIGLAQSTMEMDWSNLELMVFSTGNGEVSGLVYLPGDEDLHRIVLSRSGRRHILSGDPLDGRVNWTVVRGPVAR